MKIQCNVCEAAEATVLCCADEAALCCDCDQKIHAANKLANKHQRVPLYSSSQMPKCDICQDAVGYFFCIEDRALLCRKCDVAIHTANAFVSAHRRFLLTGVKVGLDATEPVAATLSVKSHSTDLVSEAKSSVSRKALSVPLPHEQSERLPIHGVGVEEYRSSKLSYTGGSFGSVAGGISQWPLDEFLGLNDFSQSFNYMDSGSSKADSGKLGESDSSMLKSDEEELDDEKCLGCVPDSSWTVPQIPSPPTASGLYWPKNPQTSSDIIMFVPDISFSHIRNHRNSQHLSDDRSRKQRLL